MALCLLTGREQPHKLGISTMHLPDILEIGMRQLTCGQTYACTFDVFAHAYFETGHLRMY